MDISKLLKRLTTSEKEQLFVLLKKDIGSTPQLDKIKYNLNQDQKILCPHCQSDDVYGHGNTKVVSDTSVSNATNHLMILQEPLFRALKKWINFKST